MAQLTKSCSLQKEILLLGARGSLCTKQKEYTYTIHNNGIVYVWSENSKNDFWKLLKLLRYSISV